MVTATRAMATATKRVAWRAMKRTLAMDVVIATATDIVGDNKGNGKCG